MSDEPYVGEVTVYAGDFPPRGWARCDGQILPIAQNTALFSILGTTYGGDGEVTFALPNLQGRVAVGVGFGPGLSPVAWGEQGGAETVLLEDRELPQHRHTAAQAATTNRPAAGSVPADGSALASGGTPAQAHENRPPYLVLNYCIALQGVFPPRG